MQPPGVTNFGAQNTLTHDESLRGGSGVHPEPAAEITRASGHLPHPYNCSNLDGLELSAKA